MYTGGSAGSLTSRFAQSQDTLFALAGDTGGKALLDNNDLGVGIVNAQKAESNYYILGYYTSNHEKNGKFRKIKVTVGPPVEDAKLEFRQGYYAEKEFAKFTTADKERQLEDALMLGDPITELTIALEINYFQLNRAEYFVPIAVKIPGRELALAKRGGSEHTMIDFVGEIKDSYGSTVTNLRDNVNVKLSDATALALAKKGGAEHTQIDFVGEIKDDYGGTTVTNIKDSVNIKLTDATAAEWNKRPIEYDSGYTLLPGKYTIKVLARDDETGRIGTFQTTFVIPNLNKETKRVAISSVVLASQRQAYKDAIYNVAKEKEQNKQAAANPLVQNGEKLIPSVTRVFSKGRSLFVFLQAYEGGSTAPSAAGQAPAADAMRPLIGFVSFYQGGTKVYETQPVEVTPPPNTRLGTAPLNFTVDLSSLQPGKYDCQVTVLDPSGQKGAFWQAPIMLVP
jgi:hypothetical protein